MSLEQPDPNIPSPQPSIAPPPQQEEEQPKPEQQQPEEEEEEDEEEKAKKTKGEREKRIRVWGYGVLKGQYKCPVCVRSDFFLKTQRMQKKFKYTHVDVMTPKGRKTAEKRGIEEIPFFKILRYGETKPEWIIGFNEQEFEDMK